MGNLVSVIIPIYNVEQYLKKCLDSVVNQTYKNLEIILIDDGSTDSSYDICKQYQNNDSRIRLFHINNSGQSNARNLGIKESTGDYLYFADSDDYLHEDLISFCMEKIEQNRLDTIMFNYTHVFSNGKEYEERPFSEISIDLTNQKSRMYFITNIFLPYKCGFEVWNRLYSAKVIKNNNLSFPIYKPVLGEDVCFNLKYLMYSRKALVTNKRLYYYRHREGSTISKVKDKNILERYVQISSDVFDLISKNEEKSYIARHYYLIHILLLYHELMNESLKSQRIIIKHLSNKKAFRLMLNLSLTKFYVTVKTLGITRGIKYTIYSFLYYCWSL